MKINAGIHKDINANAFTAGYINANPVIINVVNETNIENNFLLFLKIFGINLLGKNIDNPAIYTHNIANSSQSCPLI